MEPSVIFRIQEGNSPLVATAIHDGHDVRPEVLERMAISEAERRREEDPFTAQWTTVAETRIVGLRSRFEVDLNRPREKAVYIRPEDAWGLHVWKQEPPAEIVDRSLAEYDAFYSSAREVFTKLEGRFGKFVVFDLHTYNHRREGPGSKPADPQLNPEVNIGTGSMDRGLWSPVVDRFMKELGAYRYGSRTLDVRENVKFQGGNFSRWIHGNFPNSGCSLAIEFKKFFMDEWTGEPDRAQLDEIRQALASTVPGVLEELEKLNRF